MIFKPSQLPAVEQTKEEVQAALVHAMKGILGSGVTLSALADPTTMTIEEICLNLHLYERLGIAMAAVGALRGYNYLPRGFVVKEKT